MNTADSVKRDSGLRSGKTPDYATGKLIDPSRPEERVRQEFERILVESYGYRRSDIDIEVRIPRGSGHFADRADIVVYSGLGRDPAQHPLGIVETKGPSRKEGLAQLKSYMTATSAVWGVWTNGDDIAYLCRDGLKVLEDHLNNIPVRGQSVADVGRLERNDLRPFDRSELKSAFRRILRTLYANTNISRREKLGSEMIKIIFSKLEDERTYADRPPRFRAESGESISQVAGRVKDLFGSVREELKHDGIFSSHETITLDDKSVAWVVGQLERGSLLDTDSDVVGDAFEVFSESKLIGEKGEFFTPRGVVRIAVRLADPAPGDTVCDPACGSGGFLIHAMKRVWEKMAEDPKWRRAPDMRERQKHMAVRSFFGIDKETDLVKIAKAHMAIAGDGRSNIIHENALHSAETFTGDAAQHFVDGKSFRRFDMVLTNPPFGTKTKVLASDSAHFELGRKWSKRDGRWISDSGSEPAERDPYILFVERCLDMLKPGGTLAVILPETVFHAPKTGYIRQFLLKGNNLRAVIDLPHNTFRPNCNAKTCLLVLRRNEPQQETIAMATPQEMGHDHAGRTLHRPGSTEVWDDLAGVLTEIDNPSALGNRHVFTVSSKNLEPDILVPRYYRGLQSPPDMPPGCIGIKLGELVDNGIVGAWDGHGSPESQAKGMGDIPYIRVSDIVNWEMYRNPVTGIPEDVYRRILGNSKPPRAKDVIFVRRGSYRIGTVAMASPRDSKVLLTRELVTFRVLREDERGITPFYLLAMLSSKCVQDQIGNLVFVDTTLPNIGDRWRRLVIPVHADQAEVEKISAEVERSVREKWSAQERIEALRAQLGKIVT